jgi:hypothetical protein
LVGYLICKLPVEQSAKRDREDGSAIQSALPAANPSAATAQKGKKGLRFGLVFAGNFVLVAAAVAFIQISTVSGLIMPCYICLTFLAGCSETTEL